MAASAASSQQSPALSVTDFSPPISRDPRKSQQKPRVSLPSSFHGRFSIKTFVSQGLNGSFRPASISAGNQVAVDGSVDAASPLLSSESDATGEEEGNNLQEPRAQEESISSVLADVANLVKLVDSRDIVELELKHLDYELVIRKKEALAAPPPPVTFPSPQYVAQPPYPPPYALNPQPVPSAPTSISHQPPTPSSAPSSKPDLPQILSPMAGTFYKSPGPGEPAFVKVGDTVRKGQIVCIIEAMKLMNEIEADQSGTIAEILAEDGKPVAVDTPLFAIKP